MAWILEGEWCFIRIDRGGLVRRTRGATRRGGGFVATHRRRRRGSRRFDGESEDSYSLSSIVDVISGSLKLCPGHFDFFFDP
jgi:hypothetical protein